MRFWRSAISLIGAAAACTAATGGVEAAAATACKVTGGSTWTPPIDVSHIQRGAVSHAATLTCRGGGVRVGTMAGFLRSPKLACVAPPKTVPEGGVLTIFWNNGRSSRVALKVKSVNSAGHQISTGKVVSGLFSGRAAKLDIQAGSPQVGGCTDASPLVSTTYTGTLTV